MKAQTQEWSYPRYFIGTVYTRFFGAVIVSTDTIETAVGEPANLICANFVNANFNAETPEAYVAAIFHEN